LRVIILLLIYFGKQNDHINSGEDIDNEFDAFGWWKLNALKYRILSKMAKDILAIPITIVASESSFSTGGRVIDPHRVSLKTETVQMLLCGSDWVRALHSLKKKTSETVSGILST
jgi:hypothetical protein